ncbi:MAG: hypothetical protein AB1341_14650 [Bacillota bacterium]
MKPSTCKNNLYVLTAVLGLLALWAAASAIVGAEILLPSPGLF